MENDSPLVLLARLWDFEIILLEQDWMEIEPDIDFQFPSINISKIPLSVKLNFFLTKVTIKVFFLTNIGLMWVGAIFHWQILPNGSRIQMPWFFSVLTFLQRKMIIWLNYCTISFGKRQSRQRQSLLKTWRQPQNLALCLN